MTLIDATLSQTSSVSSPESIASQSPTKTTMGDDRDVAVQWMQNDPKIASGSTVRCARDKSHVHIRNLPGDRTFTDTSCCTECDFIECLERCNEEKHKIVLRVQKRRALSSRVFGTADIAMATYATAGSKECLVSSRLSLLRIKRLNVGFQKTKRTEGKEFSISITSNPIRNVKPSWYVR